MKRALSRKNLWDKLPDPLKAAAGRVMAVAPTAFWLGKRFRAQRRFLEAAQWWSADEAQAHQLGALRRVCGLAAERSTFYRDWFCDAGFEPGDLKTAQDLRGLPTIDKNTVNENARAMCTLPPESPEVDFVSTGGTSGQPLHFYMGRGRSAIEYAYLVTSWSRVGYRPGARMAVLRGRVVPPRRDGLRYSTDPLLNHHYFSAFHLNDETIGRYVQRIRGLGACFLHVYPSSMTALAQWLKRTGGEPIRNVRAAIAESEIVYPHQRALVERYVGCRVFSCYGHTEKLVLAAECERSSDDHVWPTYGYFELLDADGAPISTPGQRGEIVATGFLDTVTPFIRYRTGDFATYVADRCDDCGRQHVRLREIRGHRTQEHLVAADGAEISWTAMNMHDDTFERVRQFQFRQDRPGEALLRLVPARGDAPPDLERMLRSLERKFAGRMRIRVELVAEIPLSARGKAIYVDQRIPRASEAPVPEEAVE